VQGYQQRVNTDLVIPPGKTAVLPRPADVVSFGFLEGHNKRNVIVASPTPNIVAKPGGWISEKELFPANTTKAQWDQSVLITDVKITRGAKGLNRDLSNSKFGALTK